MRITLAVPEGMSPGAVVLTVSAFAREGGRFRRGMLVFEPDAPVPAVWRPARLFGRSAQGVPLTGPFHVHGAGPVVGPGSRTIKRDVFRLLSVGAADRYWELAVPARDLALVRAALSDANSA